MEKSNNDEMVSEPDRKNTNGEPPSTQEAKSRFEKFKLMCNPVNILKSIVIEPYIICYILPIALSGRVVNKLELMKACRVDLGYPEYICEQVVVGSTESNVTISALDESQKLLADMTAWSTPIRSSIPTIIILFIGAWSDKTGNRRVMMLLSIFGEMITCIGLLLTTYYFLEWPLWITGLIESVPPAVCGGLPIAFMGLFSYIADVTTVESRTFRVGLVGIVTTLSASVGSSLSGFVEQMLGFYGTFGIGLALYTTGFLYVYFRLKDVRREPLKGGLFEKVMQFFNPKNVWNTFSLIFFSRGKKLLSILLIIVAHTSVNGPVTGEAQFINLYALKKFQMDLVEFGLFETYFSLVGVIGTSIAMTIFSKLLKVSDPIIGGMASISKIVSSFVYGLAPNKIWFYSGPIFDLFGNCGSTIVRSFGTKIVEPHEVGKMVSLVGFIESLYPMLYGPLYSKVYYYTLETTPGAIYILGGIMTSPALIIYIYFYIMQKRAQKDVVKNPDSKEMYAHENAVTVL